MRDYEFDAPLRIRVKRFGVGRTTRVVVKGHRYTGVGESTWNANDPYDVQVGIDIAGARALRNLADQMERKAGNTPPGVERLPARDIGIGEGAIPGNAPLKGEAGHLIRSLRSALARRVR